MILSEVTDAVQRTLSTPPPEVYGDPVAHLNWLIDAHVRMTEEMLPWFTFSFMEAKTFPRRAPESGRQRRVNGTLYRRCPERRDRIACLSQRHLTFAGRADQAVITGLVCQAYEVSAPRGTHRYLYIYCTDPDPVSLSRKIR